MEISAPLGGTIAEEDEEPRNGSLAPPRYNADPRDDLHPYRSTRRGIGDPSHGRFRSTSSSLAPAPRRAVDSHRERGTISSSAALIVGHSERRCDSCARILPRISSVFPAPFRTAGRGDGDRRGTSAVQEETRMLLGEPSNTTGGNARRCCWSFGVESV